MNNEVEIKDNGIFINLSKEELRDLHHTAELRGMEVADLVNELLTEAVDEERENHPQVFENDLEVDDTKLVYSDGAGTVDAKEIEAAETGE